MLKKKEKKKLMKVNKREREKTVMYQRENERGERERVINW